MGIADNGRVLEVYCDSLRYFPPFLVDQVRWKDNSLEGGVWLPVSRSRPDKQGIIEHGGTPPKLAGIGLEFFAEAGP